MQAQGDPSNRRSSLDAREKDCKLQQHEMVYTIIVHLVAKPNHIETLRLKLREASYVYARDEETLAWHVSQSTTDPSHFWIVERYVNEASQRFHLANPYWATFDPYVKPLLEREMELSRVEEMEPLESAAGRAAEGAVEQVPEKTWSQTDYCFNTEIPN